jgi:probable F420-dependent oxidoreductase
MKINATLPFDRADAADEFLHPEAVTRVGTLLERLGFDGCNVTDHPVPTGRWLDAGGHHAQDPFVLLSFVAAVTRRLRLQTGILVLPYRNPFITARAVASLDRFSGGRVILGIGAGYLKGEYRALGVDFDRRNALTDEYLRALKAALSGAEFTFQGTGYDAPGNRIQPGPLQQPHPPLLVGGNSKLALHRAAELGDGWYPFFTGPLSATSRTAPLNTEQDLVAALAYLRAHADKIGRSAPLQIVLGSLRAPGENLSTQALIDKIGRLRALGVTGGAMHFEGRTLDEWCAAAERFASDVLSKF